MPNKTLRSALALVFLLWVPAVLAAVPRQYAGYPIDRATAIELYFAVLIAGFVAIALVKSVEFWIATDDADNSLLELEPDTQGDESGPEQRTDAR